MPPITIHRASTPDIAAIVAGNVRMALETEGLNLDADRVTAGVTHLIEHPELGHYWVASIDDAGNQGADSQRFVGQCMITTEWSDWRNQPMWWFQSVYVAPEARRTGVFSALYHYVAEQAQAAGVNDLRLYVERDNENAKATYQALGMQHSHYDLFDAVLRSQD